MSCAYWIPTLNMKVFVWDSQQKLLVKIDKNRAKIALFCLQISISCCLKTQIWQNRYFQVIMHCGTVQYSTVCTWTHNIIIMFSRALTGNSFGWQRQSLLPTKITVETTHFQIVSKCTQFVDKNILIGWNCSQLSCFLALKIPALQPKYP